MGRRWRNPITVMGVESDDNRLFKLFEFRDLPLTMRWDQEDDGGHRGARAVGVMDRVWLDEDGTTWWGEGEYADTPTAAEAEQLAAMGAQFLSCDPGGRLEYHWEVVDPDGNVVDPADIEIAYDKIYYGHEQKDELKSWLSTLRERSVFDLYEVGAITQVDIPCWPVARLALVGADDAQQSAAPRPDGADASLSDARDRTTPENRRARALLRRLAAGPASRKAEFYAKQELDVYTKLTITAEGQITGHIAAWNACHRTFTQRCVTPTYQTEFDDFHQGEVLLDDGSKMRVGAITMAEGHGMTLEKYTKLLEDLSAQLGTVRLYADDHGIQACGQVHPDIEPEQLARVLAGSPSGDWRLTDGDWLLHAIAYVNVPGYAHYEGTPGHETRMVASIPAPLEVEAGLFPVEQAFFDVPTTVLADACSTCPGAAADADQGTANEPCCDACAASGGSCGGGGHDDEGGDADQRVADPDGVLALAKLDHAMRLRGPRVPVG